MTIWFDMDGTLADLYGIENWLEYIINSDPFPFYQAKPLLSLSLLARKLNQLQKKGNEIGIITWLPKNSTEEYKKEVTKAKLFWLKKYLPSINFNEIIIVDYGTPKKNYCKSKEDWLFDDEINNRNNWDGYAFEVNNILTALKAI